MSHKRPKDSLQDARPVGIVFSFAGPVKPLLSNLSQGRRQQGHSWTSRACYACIAGGSQAHSSSTSSSAGRLQLLPVGTLSGSQSLRYVWDNKRIRTASSEELSSVQQTQPERLRRYLQRCRATLRAAFLPRADQVTPDYWQYARWRASHRFFSSALSTFATQSLLRAVGVGAQRSLPTAAAINWVLKDGLGRLGRLTVATRFGQSFDADLKRFCFSTSVIYSAAIGLEFLTPLMPHLFLPLAAAANVGKSIGLTTHIATQPSFQKSFALQENLADISAKGQAQQMVFDNLGLALAISLTWGARNLPRVRALMPLLAFPLLVAGDLTSIYRELKSIHLRTLNRQRAELVADAWLQTGRVLTAAEVARSEHLLFPHQVGSGSLPLRICSLAEAVHTPQQLLQLLAQHRNDQHVLTFSPSQQGRGGDAASPREPRGQLAMSIREGAPAEGVVLGILQAAFFRQLVNGRCSSPARRPAPRQQGGFPGPCSAADLDDLLAESLQHARADLPRFLAALRSQDWQVSPFMLSSTERTGFVPLAD